jgi:hypothetical protein
MSDVETDLVLAYETTRTPADSGQLLPMIEQTMKTTDRPLKEVLVDSGYPSGEDLARCEKKGVVVYAPWNENAFTEAKRANGAKEGQIPKDRFTYDCHSSPAGPNAYLRCRLSRTICLQGRSTSRTIRSAPAIRCMSALSFPFAVRSAPALRCIFLFSLDSIRSR